MHRSRQTGAPARRRRRTGLGALTRGLVALSISATFFAVIGLGLLAVRLNEGPLSLGPLADYMVERLNADRAQRFKVGDVVLALGADGGASGLRLRDVTMLDEGGATIVHTSEVGVSFKAWDAVRGDFAPTRIKFDGASATLRRRVGGGFSIQFADAEETLEEPSGAAGGGLLDLLGSADGETGALRKLERIDADDVALTYEDQTTGQSWTADGIRLALWRGPGEVFGSMELRADLGEGNVVDLALSGSRPLDAGATRVEARFTGAEGRDLARNFPSLSWLDGVHAPIDGALDATFGDDGALIDLFGSLRVGAGEAVSADGARVAIREAALTLDFDPVEDRFEIGRAEVDTDALAAKIEGSAKLIRDDDGAIAGLVLQSALRDIAFAPPGVFAAPLRFDAGSATARMRFDPLQIDIGEARLTRGETHFDASGAFAWAGEAWTTDVKFGARDLAATELVAYWPKDAAPNARGWTERNIRDGVIETVTGFARIGAGAPQFALNFTHRDVEANVVDGMSPIVRARGTGHLDQKQFVITVDEGATELEDGQVIALDGSSFRVPDIGVYPAIGAAHLSAEGRILDILALIDQPPLGITSKFGADLSRIEGDAFARADLEFPLISDLTPDQVEVDVAADIASVRYPTPFGGLVATGGAMTLTASRESLGLTGPITIGGFSGGFDWRERFAPAPDDAPGPRTRMTLDTRMDAAALERLGFEGIVFSKGHAPITLTLTTDPGTPLTLALDANLGPARLTVPGLGLAKGEGAGSVRARGVVGNGLQITSLTAKAPGFEIEGGVSLDPAMTLRSADLARFEVGGHTALSVKLEQAADGSRTLDVKGRRLDLQWLSSLDRGGGDSVPTEAKLAVERLRLTEDLTLREATGAVSAKDGATEATIGGKVNGGAPAKVGYSSVAGGGGKLRIDAGNAGEFFRGLGYYDNGHGGQLTLDATLGPGGAREVDGEMVVQGMVVRNAPALANILSVASLIGLFDALQSGGITFSTIRTPFKLRSGKITLKDATALGPTMGLKMSGTYDTNADRIDMNGVLTPAYAVNGVLANVPLIGEVLGGAGEGLFAFTFSVKGSMDAPAVDVNPLSVLTPGALRNIFAGGGDPGPRPKRPVLRDDFTDK